MYVTVCTCTYLFTFLPPKKAVWSPSLFKIDMDAFLEP